MDQPLPLLLENLARYQRDMEKAQERVRLQLEACIAASYDSVALAAALGCTPNNVRNLKAWKERRR